MFRFILNIIFCLLILSLLIVYIIFRFSTSFETSFLYKIDGMIQSLFAALTFLVLVFIFMKPSIKIAKHIAELPVSDLDASHLRVKIVNYSLFKAYDLNVYIYEIERINISGPDISSKLLAHYHGINEGTPYLQSALIASFEDTKTNAAQVRLKRLSVSDEDIKKALNGGHTYIQIHVTIRHGLSGLQGNFVKKYHNYSCVLTGFYGHGFDSSVKTS